MDTIPENSFQNANEKRNNAEKDGGTSGILLSDFLKRFRVQKTTKKRSEGKDTMNKEEGKGVLEDIKLNQLNSGKEKEEKNHDGKVETALVEKINDEIIRPELNIEKHADFIFIPSHSKKVREPRRRTGALVMDDGTTEESYLEIHTYKSRTPTTTTRRIYLALQRLWEEKEREGTLLPDGGMVVSSCEIMRSAMFVITGPNSKIVHKEMMMLRFCPFEWMNFFVGNDGTKYKSIGTATILDDYRYVSKQERKKPEDIFNAAHIVRFGSHILNNLRSKRTKPVNYTVVLSIKGEIALVLYTRLDIILADKVSYSRTSKGLFEDLHIDDPQYAYPSVRKRILEKALKELDGRFISTGLLRLHLERTTDGSDWKLVAQKLPILPIKPKALPVRIPANVMDMITLLGEDIASAIGEYNSKRRLYETFAIHYSADIIYQAISEFKSEGNTAKHKVKFFTAILHRIAHQRGKEWIKPCPADCKYRPQKS